MNDRQGTAQRVRIHRFRDTMTLSFVVSDGKCGEESTETIYVPMDMVESLATAVRDFRHDFNRHSFSASKFATRTYSKEGRRIEE